MKGELKRYQKKKKRLTNSCDEVVIYIHGMWAKLLHLLQHACRFVASYLKFKKRKKGGENKRHELKVKFTESHQQTQTTTTSTSFPVSLLHLFVTSASFAEPCDMLRILHKFTPHKKKKKKGESFLNTAISTNIRKLNSHLTEVARISHHLKCCCYEGTSPRKIMKKPFGHFKNKKNKKNECNFTQAQYFLKPNNPNENPQDARLCSCDMAWHQTRRGHGGNGTACLAPRQAAGGHALRLLPYLSTPTGKLLRAKTVVKFLGEFKVTAALLARNECRLQIRGSTHTGMLLVL